MIEEDKRLSRSGKQRDLLRKKMCEVGLTQTKEQHEWILKIIAEYEKEIRELEKKKSDAKKAAEDKKRAEKEIYYSKPNWKAFNNR